MLLVNVHRLNVDSARQPSHAAGLTARWASAGAAGYRRQCLGAVSGRCSQLPAIGHTLLACPCPRRGPVNTLGLPGPGWEPEPECAPCLLRLPGDEEGSGRGMGHTLGLRRRDALALPSLSRAAWSQPARAEHRRQRRVETRLGQAPGRAPAAPSSPGSGCLCDGHRQLLSRESASGRGSPGSAKR